MSRENPLWGASRIHGELLMPGGSIFGKESPPEPVIAKISQETLAQMIGTTRSRVSFFINKFRKLGFIAYNGSIEGGIEVHSSLLNAVLHDRPQIKI